MGGEIYHASRPKLGGGSVREETEWDTDFESPNDSEMKTTGRFSTLKSCCSHSSLDGVASEANYADEG